MTDGRARPLSAKVSASPERAIVIGGSICGLLAARALADHFREVVVLERDELAVPGPRRGVPQGRHTHGLLVAGARALECFFPGFAAELIAAGAIEGDVARDARWFLEGGMLRPSTSSMEGFGISRPLLESIVRTRMCAVPNVTIVDRRAVDGLKATPDRRRVDGVTAGRETLSAALVVDATGRGSRTPAWLEGLGYERPQEERVEIDLRYTTRLFRRRTGELKRFKSAIVPPTPLGKRGGVIMAQEDDRWIVTLVTHFGEQPSSDINGFIEFARTLPAPWIYEAIHDTEPLEAVETIRFPASVRRRYERLNRVPEGYLVMGDALASFDPLYGQGMTVAALEALELGTMFELADGFAARFFSRAARIVDAPWAIAVANDLRMPEVRGRRTALTALTNWYVPRLLRAAHRDAAAARAFLEVSNLLAPPASLFRPPMLWRAARSTRLTGTNDCRREDAAAGIKPV